MSDEKPKSIVVRPDARFRPRIEHYKIDLPPFAPVYDRIFVYPLEAADQPEKTAGGLYVSKSTQETLGSARGLLIGAGPKAVEQLYSHGTVLGHIVLVARLSMWNRAYMAKGHMHSVMVVRASEVVANEDLQAAYDAGDMWMEMDGDGVVSICDRVNGERPRTDPKDNYEGM